MSNGIFVCLTGQFGKKYKTVQEKNIISPSKIYELFFSFIHKIMTIKALILNYKFFTTFNKHLTEPIKKKWKDRKIANIELKFHSNNRELLLI